MPRCALIHVNHEKRDGDQKNSQRAGHAIIRQPSAFWMGAPVDLGADDLDMGGQPQGDGDVEGLHRHNREEQRRRQQGGLQHRQGDLRQRRQTPAPADETLLLPAGVEGAERHRDQEIGVGGQRQALDDDHAPEREDVELQKSQTHVVEGDIDEAIVRPTQLNPGHRIDHAGNRHGDKGGDKQEPPQGDIRPLDHPGQKHGKTNADGGCANGEKRGCADHLPGFGILNDMNVIRESDIGGLERQFIFVGREARIDQHEEGRRRQPDERSKNGGEHELWPQSTKSRRARQPGGFG